MAIPPRSPGQQLRALSADDFSYDNVTSDGWEQLDVICDDLEQRGVVIDWVDEMFAVMERLDDVDLGTPGPLVHTLESTGPAYEPHLKASLHRKPSPLSVWMVNRILNIDRPDRETWLDLLTIAATHPLAAEATQDDARSFLIHQSGRGQH